jgi:hypothetical protein
MVAIKYDDLELAFDFVSSAPPEECEAYVSLDTGRIYYIARLEALDDDAPDDLETSDRYVAVPHKYDLDLGRRLALRFVEQELPHHYERVEGFFRRKGAYGRFKDLLEAEGRLNDWDEHEATATEKALREWCAENDIQIAESGDASA